MKVKKIPYEQTQSFPKFILDYISESPSLDPFYHRKVSIKNFKAQLTEKQKQVINREVLVEVLKDQYKNSPFLLKMSPQIESLLNNKTFTVATGHQLCLFTGPLYFIYKIFSTINLSEELNISYRDYHFVPVFWMASEDHDFNEVNHLNLFGDKLVWNQNRKGAVGDISTESIAEIFPLLQEMLGSSPEAQKLLNLFTCSYLENQNLASATRFLVDQLFSKYGLLVLDPVDPRLKKQAIPIIQKDILSQGHQKMIEESSDGLPKSQAHIRPINFFYMKSGFRERIEKRGSRFHVLNTDIQFSTEEMKYEIEQYPEHFSPNVLMRPLYKELILPNLAMVGGAAEISYWMQLKSTFFSHQIVYPILMLRNSLLFVESKIAKKIKKLGLEPHDFFMQEEDLHKKFILENSNVDLSLKSQILQLNNIFEDILEKTDDPGLKSGIEAELKKQINSLIKLENKLKKAEKKNHEISLNQISLVKKKLFPEKKLQERYDNMIPFFLKYGESWMGGLKNELNPLDPNFMIFIDED
jgi:bacillithiol biosynthesis cysteine-adding enzyme BshC